MIWKVNYTAQALEDLKGIYEYISLVLLSPDSASKMVEKIKKAIRSLDYMPEKYKIYDQEPWKSKELRYFPVNNYLIFYLVNKEHAYVNIIRIIYGERDITQQLKSLNTSEL